LELTLEQRLLRFLAREEEGERQTHRELRAQPIDLRVIDGDCIHDARFTGRDGSAFVFTCSENHSKFRTGDPVAVGDGQDFDAASPMAYAAYDAGRSELRLELDPYNRSARTDFVVGCAYVVDRREFGGRGSLAVAVRDAFAFPWLKNVLEGRHELTCDEARLLRARSFLLSRGLNSAQVEAGAAAIATESLALVQGPPGTGKTKLLAEVVAALCSRKCRIALCAFTHNAVDNALLAIRKVAPELELVKVGGNSGGSSEARADLSRAGVRLVDAKRAMLPAESVVVAGTCYQFPKLQEDTAFHYTVFDEAGQLPIPHALPAMLRSKRWLFFGDHRQLPPVVTSEHRDREAADSIFAHLHRRYGGHLLDTTYRMNEGVCRLVSETYYDGLLHAAPSSIDRRLPFVPGGRLDEVLDPAHSVVWVRVDHRQPGSRSHEEAHAVADVVADLVRQHGVPTREIAVIAPFRAQVQLLRAALDQKELQNRAELVVDTVERIQGQEREAVVVSLTAGDPDEARGRSAFHLNENRLNVALSRARTKVVLVASAHSFEAIPGDVDALRTASRCRELRDRLTMVDLTKLYCGPVA
jgi:DNA replication ATP-dependent helicase Dna2